MGRALLLTASLLTLGIASYRLGFMHGRRDTIHQLFAGEKDFKQYLTYRKQQAKQQVKQQMEGRDEG